MKKLIEEGAEAKIYLENQTIQKERIKKEYRHKVIDEQIRKRRTKHEAKLLYKAKEKKVNVPLIFNINKKLEPTNKYNLEIEYIDGDKLSETLNTYPEKKQFTAMEKLGKQVALMHKNDIIHSDLTTSNIILKDNQVYLIDFGLGYFSKKIEDKAVDLHLIKQALEAKHWQNHEELFKKLIKTYKFTDSEKTLERLKAVEKRGRYKH
jgi:TP53 regulating kinase and related kinases